MRTLLTLLLLSAAAHAQPVAKDDRVIVPSRRVGPITVSTSEAQMKAIFGAKQVKFGNIDGAEGQQVPGTRVLPGTADELQIFWTDNKSRKRIESIAISNPKSHWHTADGIRIGTPLTRLVELNGGKKMDFSGFDWDYGGNLMTGPALKKALPGMSFTLSHVDAQPPLTDKESAQVSGDQKVWSDNPILARLKPFVAQIFVNLK